MTEQLLPVIFVPVILILGSASMYWTFSRSRQILDRWASQNEYEILVAEYRWLRRGPFFWRTSNVQTVYYVEVRTRDGEVKGAWVRCGGFAFGMLTERVDVRWET